MFDKIQNTIAKMKIKALLNSSGEGFLKGLKFREGSRTFSLGEVQLRTNLPLLKVSLDSIESINCTHKEYEFHMVIKDLKVIAPEGEFSVEELTIESFMELKEFLLEIKGLIPRKIIW